MKNNLMFKVMTTAALLSTLAYPIMASGASLSDLEGSYAKDAIQELVEKGIITGNGSGRFDPTGNITRQDFAIIMSKALNLDTDSPPATSTFSDVPQSHYSFSAVEAAVKAGLIKGQGNGSFGIGQNLTRQDMAVLFVRALGVDPSGKGAHLNFSDGAQIANYAKDSVGAAVELGLIRGNPDGSFDPSGSAERQAVALVTSRFLETKEELSAIEGNPSPDDSTETPAPEPEKTTPPATNTSSGSSNSSGGSSNPGSSPTETVLSQPALSFKDAKTLLITYSENLNTHYVPSTSELKVFGRDGETPIPLEVSGIAINGKAVEVTFSQRIALGRSIELTYSPIQAASQVRSVSGKTSPSIASTSVTYQVNDVAVLLGQLIEEAEQLQSQIKVGHTTGSYLPASVEPLKIAILSAKEVVDNPYSELDELTVEVNKLLAALDHFDAYEIVKPLTVSQVANEVVLKPGKEVEIYVGQFDNNYDKQSISNFIKIQRGTVTEAISYNPASEGSFQLYSGSSEIIGTIEITSSDDELVQVIEEDGYVTINPSSEATEDDSASLTFTVKEEGEVVQEPIVIPVRFDTTAPTVTSATYQNNQISITTNEPLFSGSFSPSFNIFYSPSGEFKADMPGDIIGLTFSNHRLSDSKMEITIEFSQEDLTPITLSPTGAFRVIVNNSYGDFVGNKLVEPVTIKALPAE